MNKPAIHPYEVMIVAMSRLVKNGERAAAGTLSPVPAASLLLAAQTHAPDLDMLIYGDKDLRITDGLYEFFGLAQRKTLDLFFLSGIQIDRSGSINLSVIGDYSKPDLRLPGGAASNMLSMMAGRIILFTMTHTSKLFVPQVSFVNAVAKDDNLTWRRGVLSHVVTPLCLMKYDEAERVIRLDSLFPETSFQKVVENTGFEPGVAEKEVAEIKPVSERELELLRGPVRRKLDEIYPLFTRMLWGPLEGMNAGSGY